MLQNTCPGLVGQIEKGELDTPATRAILENALKPMLAQGIDRVVMGCTHYPFVIPLIQEIVGSNVNVIDPAPAVARQVRRVLAAHELQTTAFAQGSVRYLTSGDPEKLFALLPRLMGIGATVCAVHWGDDLQLD